MGLKILVSIVTSCLLGQLSMCKPVNIPTTSAPRPEPDVQRQELDTGLEYDRYLKQVVEILESNAEFREKLKTANISDITSGAIGLDLLKNNSVRTKLDEIKRMEIQRLQEIARVRAQLIEEGGNVKHMEKPAHIDAQNPHTFELKDLENLITKTTKDLKEMDRQRREQYKEYKMEKEFEYQQKLKELPEEERVKFQQRREELQKRHKDHEKINHPGSKDQMEEVWQEDDKMKDQEFDPKTFFIMHDLNGDKMWDIQEAEAVLQRELDKMYNEQNTEEEDDPVQRDEEMSRMREHLFKEVDADHDLMISLKEFLEATGVHGENDEFKENKGWETVDDKPAFTDDEYKQYVEQHHAQPGVVLPPKDDTLQFSPEYELIREQEKKLQEMMEIVPNPEEQDQNLALQPMPSHQQGGSQERSLQQGKAPEAIPPHQQGGPQEGSPQQGKAPEAVPPHQQGGPQEGSPQQGKAPEAVSSHQQGKAPEAVPQHQPDTHQQGTLQQGKAPEAVPTHQPDLGHPDRQHVGLHPPLNQQADGKHGEQVLDKQQHGEGQPYIQGQPEGQAVHGQQHVDPGNEQPHGEPGHEQPHGEPGHEQPHGEPGHEQPHSEPGHEQPHGDPGHEQPHDDQGHDEPHGEPDHEQPHGDPDHDEPHGDPGHDKPHGEPGHDEPHDDQGHDRPH